jgi:hypothetical protein
MDNDAMYQQVAQRMAQSIQQQLEKQFTELVMTGTTTIDPADLVLSTDIIIDKDAASKLVR